MKTRTKAALWVVGVLVVCGVGFRLYLPTLALDYVNRELNRIPGYKGHVADINIKLWRGAYQIKEARLDKLNAKVPVPFIRADLIDLSIQWKALLHRSIAGRIILDHPVINIVEGPSEAQSQTKVNKESSMDVIKHLMPFKINRLVVRNGEIHFRDYHKKPKVDIALDEIQAFATNLSNVRSENTRLPAHVQASARCFESGTLTLAMAIDPFNRHPTFELKERLTGVQLTKLNDFLDAYAKVKAKSGTFAVFTEIAAKDGSYTGYTKPIIKDLKIDKMKEADKPLKLVWAWFATIIGKVFSNPAKKQLASKIPINGTFSKTKIDIWAAIGSLLENAFVRALAPTLDQTIHLQNVKT